MARRDHARLAAICRVKVNEDDVTKFGSVATSIGKRRRARRGMHGGNEYSAPNNDLESCKQNFVGCGYLFSKYCKII